MPVQIGENTPLLSSGLADAEFPIPSKPSSTNFLLKVCALMVILDISGYLAIAPQTKIFQDIICADYYLRSNGSTATALDISHYDCKIEPITSEVALINGWKDTFDQLPGIVFALPWGIAADRVGRKPVLLLGVLGCLLGELWMKSVCKTLSTAFHYVSKY
jgi:MFS family permease